MFQGEFQGIPHDPDTTAVHHPTGKGNKALGFAAGRGALGGQAALVVDHSAPRESLEKARFLPHRITLIKCQ